MASTALEPLAAAHTATLPWVQTIPGVPYFATEDGRAWTPIGQNDAVTWVDLRGLYRRRNLPEVEAYLAMLAGHGVTVLRLMLEYCQFRGHYFEDARGRPRPAMVRLWDDLFALCEKHGLRLLLTPVDTFWMWIRWDRHPWNQKNNGPCANIRGLLPCPESRQRIKERLSFCVDRWGGSGALFAWDVWNEIHPSYAGDSAECFDEFIGDLSGHIRERELARYGRCHPQTCSIFSPHLVMHPAIPEAIYRHGQLDVCSTHLYESGAIDHPKNTVDAAIRFGELTRSAIAEAPAGRPYFDSEHGPIHTFKDRRRSLPEKFDDEYFRHMQWAHLASGGAGGGMRWPNRHPHRLTLGMRREQSSLARFLPLIDWTTFRRRVISPELGTNRRMARFGCADGHQAVLYLLRRDSLAWRRGGAPRRGMLRQDAPPVADTVRVPGMAAGRYRVTAWDTAAGEVVREWMIQGEGDGLEIVTPPFVADMAIAVTPAR